VTSTSHTHPPAEIQYQGFFGLPFGHVTLIHDLQLAVNPQTRRIKYHLDQWRVMDAILQVRVDRLCVSVFVRVIILRRKCQGPQN
jgi:hypothetical protein